ncbi:type I-F CRISPR-associated protein Csy2 [Candidatus Thalassolituus haligoni]|uniref:type I-F CRISPR-associated protein Csy2 n=1 Tax=Candidatus Thalassolituus haligoni TaxID=3100113 RepID=UPI0035122576
MKHLLLLKHLKVENANAISGMTWGFPAPTNFLGFAHALSRKCQAKWGEQASLGGVGIICHNHQVHTQRPSGFEHVFALSRNPLTKDGNTAPFNEEGRMHMTASLLLECEFDPLTLSLGDDLPEQRIRQFEAQILDWLVTQRLAGGIITQAGRVRYLQLDENSDDGQRVFRREMLRLIPGFVLLDRSDLLAQHHQAQQQQNPDAELLDSWLDFIALCYQPEPTGLEDGEAPIPGETKAEWQLKPKPGTGKGYLVPLAVGYQAISRLYDAGTVNRARDNSVPFRFVESAYSIGEWCSPHRLQSPDELLWQYRHHGDAYLCAIPSQKVTAAENSDDDDIDIPDNDFNTLDELY